jgi:hypothetical protein
VLGGQEYSEIVFVETDRALEAMKRGDLKPLAQASAVIDDRDAAINADYENGVAVFTFDANGAMVEAAVGGQTFKYQPK